MRIYYPFSENKIIIILFILLGYAISFAQTASPYSRYGLGQSYPAGLVKNFSLGGIGVAVQNDSVNPTFINNVNPASYASCRNTTIEAGIDASNTNLKSTNTSYRTNKGSFGYLALLFPIGKRWGTAIGLTPYTTVNYNIKDEQYLNASLGNLNYLYEGTGSINRIFFGNSYKYKNLSLGANISYLFGSIENSRKVIFSDTSNALNIRNVKRTQINNLVFDYGIQYVIKINAIKKRELKEKIQIILGATYSNSSNVSSQSNILTYSYIEDLGISTGVRVKDTIENYVNKRGKITLPMNMGYGISLKKGEKWLIGADYKTYQWSQYSFYGDNPGLKNSYQIALGCQYTPDARSEMPRSYFKKVNYRTGFRFLQSNLELKNTQINEYAFSLGLGLPVGKIRQLYFNYSMINIGFEIGKRGTISNGLIQENFIQMKIGFTMNDKWFLRSKID